MKSGRLWNDNCLSTVGPKSKTTEDIPMYPDSPGIGLSGDYAVASIQPIC
jgi:hypothetical protein